MSSQTIAEELAKKCASDIDLVQECQGVRQQHELQGIVLQSIPLVELLELYKETNSRCCRHASEADGTNCPTCIAISNLTTKLKQLGIEL